MISLATSTAQPFLTLRGLREQDAAATARDKTPVVALPSLAEMRDAQKAQKKEMAARKVQSIRERMDALKLMVKLDPKAALKMTAGFAKELRAAVKDYVEAGGKNPTNGEMKMAMKQASEARDAADAAADGLPAEPGTTEVETVDAGTLDSGALDSGASAIDAETKRAQAAYATAAGIAEDKDGFADRMEAVLGLAFADQGFFEQVKIALGDIKAAREKIKADWTHPRKPDEDDWKVADKELAELEREIDLAPTGMPAAPAEVSVKA